MTQPELGPVVLDVVGTTLSESDVNLLQNPWVGGVILFSRNYTDVMQLCGLTAEIRKASPNIVIAVDHEGGRVQRFGGEFTPIPAMQQLGNLYVKSPVEALALTHETGWLLAAELIACGLDMSFTPVLDVDDCRSQIIGSRSFGPDPATVIALSEALTDGLLEAGMSATGKHFPGHGGVAEDSHLELPVDNRSFDEVARHDLQPFKALLPKLEAIMPAHIHFPQIASEPVGFSSFWLQQVLREDLGFNGIIFSDDLTMEGAVTAGDYGERTLKALAAGCDSVLICNNPAGAQEALARLDATFSTVFPSRLECMRAKRCFEWDSLRGSARAKGVRAQLESLVARS